MLQAHGRPLVEDGQAEVLRTMVRDVLQEYGPHNEPSSMLAHTSVHRHRVPTPRRRATSSRLRRPLSYSNVLPSDDSPLNDMLSPSPITRAPPPHAAAASTATAASAAPPAPVVRRSAPMAAAAEATGPSRSATTSADSSMLHAAAPLFNSTANDTSFESSTASQRHRHALASDTNNNSHHNDDNPSMGADHPLPLTVVDQQRDGGEAAATVVQTYDRERAAGERQMRQALRDLEQRQQQLLSKVASDVATTNGPHASARRDKTHIKNKSNSSRNSHNGGVADASVSSSVSGHVSSPPSSARASTAAPAPPSRLTALQERFAMMPIVQ
ncbi:hypothetical protein DQ04_18811000 [Trypanosoma grayi]|uniref:hypothetical protein n=1 Tax=Trypanosoma grayi TaxID=71804 RepID=UPI0004F42F32|nr:hypothetical protein DQ04_18811000 [Trypanosoma grayi]KEG05741.1 hypothetical protein DQ04_18811000 [Trypanosoma grayi]